MSVTITHTSSHRRLIDICLAAVAKAEARTFLSWERVGYSRLTVPRAACCCGGYAAALGGDAATHAPCGPGELHAGGGSTAAASASIVARSHDPSGARLLAHAGFAPARAWSLGSPPPPPEWCLPSFSHRHVLVTVLGPRSLRKPRDRAPTRTSPAGMDPSRDTTGQSPCPGRAD